MACSRLNPSDDCFAADKGPARIDLGRLSFSAVSGAKVHAKFSGDRVHGRKHLECLTRYGGTPIQFGDLPVLDAHDFLRAEHKLSRGIGLAAQGTIDEIT